jgi:hypothetical protein
VGVAVDRDAGLHRDASRLADDDPGPDQDATDRRLADQGAIGPDRRADAARRPDPAADRASGLGARRPDRAARLTAGQAAGHQAARLAEHVDGRAGLARAAEADHPPRLADGQTTAAGFPISTAGRAGHPARHAAERPAGLACRAAHQATGFADRSAERADEAARLARRAAERPDRGPGLACDSARRADQAAGIARSSAR